MATTRRARAPRGGASARPVPAPISTTRARPTSSSRTHACGDGARDGLGDEEVLSEALLRPQPRLAQHRARVAERQGATPVASSARGLARAGAPDAPRARTIRTPSRRSMRSPRARVARARTRTASSTTSATGLRRLAVASPRPASKGGRVQRTSMRRRRRAAIARGGGLGARRRGRPHVHRCSRAASRWPACRAPGRASSRPSRARRRRAAATRCRTPRGSGGATARAACARTGARGAKGARARSMLGARGESVEVAVAAGRRGRAGRAGARAPPRAGRPRSRRARSDRRRCSSRRSRARPRGLRACAGALVRARSTSAAATRRRRGPTRSPRRRWRAAIDASSSTTRSSGASPGAPAQSSTDASMTSHTTSRSSRSMLAHEQASAPGARLPRDALERVAGHVVAQLAQLVALAGEVRRRAQLRDACATGRRAARRACAASAAGQHLDARCGFAKSSGTS